MAQGSGGKRTSGNGDVDLFGERIGVAPPKGAQAATIRVARRSMSKDELKRLEDQLWRAADNLRANSDLKSSEYSIPVLGLIFLRFADNNYRRYEAEIVAEYEKLIMDARDAPRTDSGEQLVFIGPVSVGTWAEYVQRLREMGVPVR